MPKIKRAVGLLWLRGWDHLPDLIHRVSWELHNPDWALRFLGADAFTQFVEVENSFNGQTLDAISNIVRNELLVRYRGVWADGTTHSRWIDLTTASGFLALSCPEPDRTPSTWFSLRLVNRPTTRSIALADMKQLFGAKWARACLHYEALDRRKGQDRRRRSVLGVGKSCSSRIPRNVNFEQFIGSPRADRHCSACWLGRQRRRNSFQHIVGHLPRVPRIGRR
jgi:hypothetical protein